MGWLPSTLAEGEFGASGRDPRRLSIPGKDRAWGGGRRLQHSASVFLRDSGPVRWFLTSGARSWVWVSSFLQGEVCFSVVPGRRRPLAFIYAKGGGEALPWLAGERACRAAREQISGVPGSPKCPSYLACTCLCVVTAPMMSCAAKTSVLRTLVLSVPSRISCC